MAQPNAPMSPRTWSVHWLGTTSLTPCLPRATPGQHMCLEPGAVAQWFNNTLLCLALLIRVVVTGIYIF